MKDFICKKCRNTTYIVQEKSNGTGVATGLYCAKCGTWHKWLNKQEKILYTTHNEEIDKDKEISRLTEENKRLRAEKTCRNISDKNPVDEFKCSKCGFMTEDFHRLVIDEDDGEHINYEYIIKYCPNCGAKVEDEQ